MSGMSMQRAGLYTIPVTDSDYAECELRLTYAIRYLSIAATAGRLFVTC